MLKSYAVSLMALMLATCVFAQNPNQPAKKIKFKQAHAQKLPKANTFQPQNSHARYRTQTVPASALIMESQIVGLYKGSGGKASNQSLRLKVLSDHTFVAYGNSSSGKATTESNGGRGIWAINGKVLGFRENGEKVWHSYTLQTNAKLKARKEKGNVSCDWLKIQS